MRELASGRALLASGTGILILGEHGVGKTALARELGRHATSGGAAVGHLLGHAVSSKTAYEAFAGVLVEQPSREVNVVEVAHRLSAAFAPSGGGRWVLVVDDAQLIDEQSAKVLLQLATDGTAVVIATAPARVQLPVAIDRLWRDGLCERIDLEPLSAHDVRTLLETVLDGPVEAGTIRELAQRSGGNALLLRELLTTVIDRSVLVLGSVDGSPVWMLDGEPPVSSGIRDAVADRLGGLSDAHRAALELVAAGEPIAAAVAAAMVGDTALDELATERLIAVREGLAGPEVISAHPIYGDVLRADLPPLRLHRLRLALAHRLESANQPVPHDLVRAAVWRLDAGQADDPDRLLTAARAARGISLGTAERLARRAYEASGSLPAALLLAEILTHTGRHGEATALAGRLPPDSLRPADREALVYCAAHEHLMTGQTDSGADLVAAVLAGDPAASDQLHGLHAAFVSFDARFGLARELAAPIVHDAGADPVARTLAGMAAVGASYWTGRFRDAVTTVDRLAPVTAGTRDAVPYGAASLELFAVCALAEGGNLDAADERARRMQRQAEADRDVFAGPRADYCLGRVALLRGQAETARRLFTRCLATLTPFDRFIGRHVGAMLVRAAAACGDVDAARAALAAAATGIRMKTYEPEDELAEAAALAAALQLNDAGERAAWAAGVAAAHGAWSAALTGYHDAARYGAARHVLIPAREAVGRVDGTLAWCYLDHATALAAGDAAALDEIARRFESHGALLFAAEAAAEAALAHARADHPRPARASGAHATHLWARCQAAVSPWLTGATTAVPLTNRERQAAALAASGLSDAAIATRLGISIRTVQTHLGHCYDKLGSTGRADLAARLANTAPATPASATSR
jgi:DNA-binding CsgD family transcriptional regulator